MIISFDEKTHSYTFNGKEIPSVTQIIGTVYGTGLEKAPKHFVERAAEKGTNIHKAIETYLNEGKDSNLKEFKLWKNWWGEHNDGNYQCEKIVFGNTKDGYFAGTLDFFHNGFIYDWKTCKTATRKQVEKWQKQLSFYIYALRQMGYAVNEPAKVVHLTDKIDFINVDYLGDEFVEETMALYKDIKEGKKTQEQAILSEQKELETVSKKDLVILEDVLLQMKALETVVNEYRDKIRAEMERRGILNVTAGKVTMTYVPGTIRQTFDSKSFKNDDPDLYAIYLKDTEVKPSVRITVK